MTRAGQMLSAGFAVVIGAALLTAMMWSNPGYDRALRPFVTDVAAGANGQTRAFAAAFTGWETAGTITFPYLGREATRSTGGIFLVTEVSIEGGQSSTKLSAVWEGASGRLYQETLRISDLPQQLVGQWAQPGLESRAIAIFELPPDEISGGALLLSLPFDPRLEGKLRLLPPDAPLGHLAERKVP